MPHFALSDIQLGGFIIPKGSTVSGSLYHSMRDPRFFKDPEVFNPGRFLDKGTGANLGDNPIKEI